MTWPVLDSEGLVVSKPVTDVVKGVVEELDKIVDDRKGVLRWQKTVQNIN